MPDHTYVTLEYPGGRDAVFTSIESNAFDNYYEAYYGTKGTLILQGEIDAYLFEEGAPAGEAKATGVEVAPQQDRRAPRRRADAADAAGAGKGVGAASGGSRSAGGLPHRDERVLRRVRVGAELKCGPERALGSARACIAGYEAIEKKTRVEIDP